MYSILAAAEEGAEGGINAYLVGAIALGILLLLLFALLSFGKGREHT